MASESKQAPNSQARKDTWIIGLVTVLATLAAPFLPVSALISLFPPLSPNSTITRLSLTLLLVIPLWLYVNHYCRKRVTHSSPIIGVSNAPRPAYSLDQRRGMVVGATMVTLVLFVSNSIFIARDNQIIQAKHNVGVLAPIILVANFAGPSSQVADDYGVTQIIRDQLDQALAKYAPTARLQWLNETIPSVAAARAIGERQHAQLILWGWYRKTETTALITSHFDILGEPDELIHPAQDEVRLTARIANLQDFSIQTRLSKQMTFLSLLTIGLVYFDEHNYKDAINQFSGAMQEAPLSNQVIDPTIAPFYRASSYFAVRSYSKAIADLTSVIHQHPKLINPWLNRCIARFYEGDKKLAQEDCSQAIAIAPHSSIAYYDRGVLLADIGDDKDALTTFTLAIRYDRANSAAYYNRAFLYKSVGNLSSAIANLTQAIHYHPKFYPAYIQRAGLYAIRNNSRDALNDYRQAINVAPNDYDAYYYRAQLYARLGRQTLALSDTSHAINLGMKTSQVFSQRGRLYLFPVSSKHWSSPYVNPTAAVSDYTRAIKLNPKQAVLYSNRAWAYVLQDKFDLAFNDATIATTYNPVLASPYYIRSLVYFTEGNIRGADANMQKAQALSSGKN